MLVVLSSIFVTDTKIVSGYTFGAPLNLFFGFFMKDFFGLY